MTESTFKKVCIIGVPLGYGAGQMGSELGSAAMRSSKIRGSSLVEHIESLGFEVEDFGDIPIQRPVATSTSDGQAKYLSDILPAFESIYRTVKERLSDARLFPVILGGDHSIAISTFAAISSTYRERNEDIGLIWFDAHADINTPETSSSGNIHGMPLAALLGYGNEDLVNVGGFSPKIKSKFLAHVGGRDFDDGERRLIRDLGIRDRFFTMSDIDRRGMSACVEDAISIASGASGGYAVTFDIDMIDPRFAPGSGTLVRGGTTYREAHLALEMIAEHGGMRSFEIVEVNPLLDQSNITVELGCELVLSALGKTIL